MMTRKDYIATAEILNSFGDVMTSADHCDIVDAFADVMQSDNPRFDRKRFAKACGIYED